MKTLSSKLGVVMLAGSLLMASGCGGGGGSSSTPGGGGTITGKVVKGPVAGASILNASGTIVATTDSSGNFTTTGTGPFSTTGGTYIDLTTGQTVAAPPMQAPAGVSQITPLSTLVATASPANAQAILAGLANLGVNLNTDLSVKTSQNAAAIILSESVGTVLAQAQTSCTPAQITSLTTALVGAVVSATSSTTPVTAASVSSAITTKISDDTNLTSVKSYLDDAATSSARAAEDLPNGSLPTGSSGGTSSTR